MCGVNDGQTKRQLQATTSTNGNDDDDDGNIPFPPTPRASPRHYHSATGRPLHKPTPALNIPFISTPLSLTTITAIVTTKRLKHRHQERNTNYHSKRLLIYPNATCEPRLPCRRRIRTRKRVQCSN